MKFKRFNFTEKILWSTLKIYCFLPQFSFVTNFIQNLLTGFRVGRTKSSFVFRTKFSVGSRQRLHKIVFIAE